MADKKETKKTNKLEVPETELSKSEAKKTRNYLIIMIVLAILTILVGGYFIWRYVQKNIKVGREIKATDITIAKYKQKLSDLEDLKPNYDKVTATSSGQVSDADRIKRALPLNTDVKNLLGMMQNIGQQSGVSVLSITPQDSGNIPAQQAAGGKPAQPQQLTYTTTITGSYPQIIQFLKNVEKSARVMNVNSMDISGNNENLRVQLTMVTYYQGEANLESTKEPLK
ncbi:MAG: type 4a pilus biogenesis protein PilO [bacterium]|nr:type 4a pilus biogenesis protein PilO [bacterium]